GKVGRPACGKLGEAHDVMEGNVLSEPDEIFLAAALDQEVHLGEAAGERAHEDRARPEPHPGNAPGSPVRRGALACPAPVLPGKCPPGMCHPCRPQFQALIRSIFGSYSGSRQTEQGTRVPATSSS